MALLPLNLHLDEGDQPVLNFIFESRTEGRGQLASVAVPLNQAQLQVIATPRVLRSFAEDLLAVADEACRREDALNDEPLPLDDLTPLLEESVRQVQDRKPRSVRP